MLRATISVEIRKNWLVSLIRRLPRRAEEAVEGTLDAGQQFIVQGMYASSVPSAPGAMPGVRSAALVGSIQKFRQKRSGYLQSNTPYDAFLEYGTSRMAARPFMTPAAEHMRQVMVEYVREMGGGLVIG